ncbi:hypothetical protein BC332_20756 [Capsicum chinense]|nr:hypothetical protein BC332_20756 [Capsicum chinense]
MHGEVDVGTEEKIMTTPKTQDLTIDEKMDETVLVDSQDTIPDDLLLTLNVYNSKRIIVHPSVNRKIQTPIAKLRIRRPSKFKESPYTMKFGSAATRGHVAHVNEYKMFRMHAVVPWHTVEDIYIPVNIKEKNHWVLAILSFSEWCIFLYDSYESSGHYSVVLDVIEKLAAIIPLCLEHCDFYVKKGIHVENHPRYKDKDSSDMFDVLFQENLPQQPSESLNCGVYMVTYVECLSYGHKILATEFDPNALRTRYVATLWDYGTRKQELNAHSDVEAPLRPPRQSRITSVTKVFDV